jgi:signal transduction histidine kinase
LNNAIHIFLADDDNTSLSLVTQAVKKWGFSVTTFTDGASVANAMQKASSPFLAVLDWMMPEMTGLEAIACFKQSSKRPPAYTMLLTSRNSPVDILNALRSGADDFLSKPVDLDQLKVRIQMGIEKIEFFQKQELQVALNNRNAHLAAIATMAAGVAHEVNNPLAIVSGMASQIEREAQRPEPSFQFISERAKKVSAQSARISKIVKNLLRFSEDFDVEKFELKKSKEFIDNCVGLCRMRFEQYGIELRLKGFSDSILLNCRPASLSQAILNLLNNSFDAIRTAKERWIEIEMIPSVSSVRILVTDSGPGIPEAFREKILLPFFTTKEVGAGLGLGLSVSHGILKEHRGELFHNPAAANTQFILTLPAVESSAHP